MTAELHQRAKQIFNELLDAGHTHRESLLERLDEQSPELAREVRSLLDYHTAQSFVLPPANGPKIRTRSTLSTTLNSRTVNWRSIAGRTLGVLLPCLLSSWFLISWIDRTLRMQLKEDISTRLADVADLRVQQLKSWEQKQLAAALAWSQDAQVLSAIHQAVALAQTAEPLTESLARDRVQLANEIGEALMKVSGGPLSYSLWSPRLRLLTEWSPNTAPRLDAVFANPLQAEFLAPAIERQPRICLPRDLHGGGSVAPNAAAPNTTTWDAQLLACLPIYDAEDQVEAVALIDSAVLAAHYTELVADWARRPHEESYLINARGVMLTRSRYADAASKLAAATSQPKTKNSAAAKLMVRDPGVDLLRGEQPVSGAAAWPPTLLARELTSGSDGLYVDGYRNYLGCQVVGAWRWLPEQQIGLAVEQHAAEAFAAASSAKRGLWLLAGWFSLGVLGLALGTALERLRKRRLRDTSEVGPYLVQELLGEGGMGRVYLAEHALLCRQSAVKVLTKGATDLSIISRFEREVQLASQLTHPNTIAIYDFGRTQDGIFYYAMEYIHGAHLGQLVEYAGAIEPGRCIYILRQLCRALHEAHQAGVVHRDIKPQNIMVCDRGGEPDFVKLFDYGLVKAFAPGVSQTASQTRIVVGTPRFMAPERLNSPWLADPRVDVYSVGAVAYFLLTGKLPPLVTLGNQLDHEQPGIETLDLPPSVVEFGGILSICLSVEPSARPSSMLSLLRELDNLSERFPWSRSDSLRWWNQHAAKLLHLVQNQRKKLARGEIQIR